MLTHLFAPLTLLLAQAEEAPAQDAATDPIAESEFGRAASDLVDKLVAGRFGEIGLADLVPVLLPIAQAIILILIVLLASRWVKGIVVKGASKARVEMTLAKFFGNLAKWAVLLLGALAVFNTFGFEVTSFTAVLAGLTVGVGLALSGTLGNIAAGVMLLIFRPFKVGDVVRVADVFGTVDEIELFTTAVDTFDKRRIIVPNSQIVGAIIENVSHHPTRRVDVTVGVAYQASIDATRAALEKALASVELGLQDPAPQVVLGDLGDSAVGWTVRLWVNAGDFWPAKEALTRAVKMALDDAGISIPFPQMDVHLDGKIEKAG